MARNKYCGWVVALLACCQLGAFLVMPNNDDFFSLPAPHAYEGVSVFLPNGAFWRPFDALWGLMMGKCVWAFPFLNHLMVLACYAFCVYGLYWALKASKVEYGGRCVAMSMVLLSPALVATTCSVDSINQVACMALGIASLMCYDRSKPLAYALIMLSVFTKESGVAWLAATPLLALVIDEERRGVRVASLRKYMKLSPPCAMACSCSEPTSRLGWR